MYAYLTMTVPAELQAQCNALSFSAAGEAGKDVWTTPLSPTGKAPATHYIASGAVGEDMAALLTDTNKLADATGLPFAEAHALLSAVDIIPIGQNTAPEGAQPNAETLDQTLDRLGLMFVRGEP